LASRFIILSVRGMTGGPCEQLIFAGPTCDGTDIIYQHSECRLPLDLAFTDPVDSLSAGAYTASYASVEFNGLPPLRNYFI
jgi:ornithine decarboxylase